jgi:hypothetical protein
MEGAVPATLHRRRASSCLALRSALGLLHVIRADGLGGRRSVPGCALEVLTADGTSCGFAEFSASLAGSAQRAALVTANTGSGPPCQRDLNVGRDGTVISVGRATGNACSPFCAVLWDWFPAFFR